MGGHPGFQDMQAAAPPAKAGSAQATLVHMRVCPLVSAALCRLLTQATGKVTVKSLLYPGPGDAPLPDSGHPCGWPCWAQCRPSVDTVDGLKRQAGRHMAAGQGLLLPAPTQGPAVPPLPTLPPSVPTIPTPFLGLAGLPFAILLTMPRPSTAGPRKGRGQLGSGFLVDWLGRGKRILRMFSSWFIRYLPAKAAGGGVPPSVACSGWVWFLLLAE